MASKLSRWLPTAALVKSFKWRLIAAWVLGSLLLLWGSAYLLVPVIAKSQIEKIATQKLGRAVTVGLINFKPWSLELAVDDLSIAKTSAAPAGTSQLSIKRIYIDAELESLLRLAPVVNTVALQTPSVSLSHLGSGRYDIDDILDKLKSPADAAPGDPLRFALYNLSLTGGQLSFTDQAVSKTHQLTDVTLSVPFLSNLPSKRDVTTEPRLAFKVGTLGGPAPSSFDSAAEGTPFAQTRKTDAALKLANFDLAPYAVYLPTSLPYKLAGGILTVDAKLVFEQNPSTAVKLSGLVRADKVEILSNVGNRLLSVDQLNVTMADVQPLAQLVKLAGIEVINPAVNISRDRAGRLNLLPSVRPTQDAVVEIAPKSGAASARKTSALALNEPQKELQTSTVAAPAAPVLPAARPWKITIVQASVRGGSIAWLDDTLGSPASIKLGAVVLEVTDIAMPFAPDAPLAFSGSMALAPSATAVVAGASLPAIINFTGSATDQGANVSATVAAWPLASAANYVSEFLLPTVGGRVDAQLGVTWQAPQQAKPQALRVIAPEASVSNLLLAQGNTALASVKRIQLDGAEIDVAGQTLKVAKLQVIQPKATIERDTDKRWMFERWLASKPLAADTSAPASQASQASAPSWAIAVDSFSVAGGAMKFIDRAPGGPASKQVAVDVNDINAQLGGFTLGDQPGAKPSNTPGSKPIAAKLMPLTATLRLVASQFEPAKLNFKGSVGLAPLQVDGQLLAERVPVQAFEPYFADALNVELLRADASFKGKVAYQQTPAGPAVQVSGDAAVEELKANTLAPSEDLLEWKALNLRGLSVALSPAKPAQVDVQETSLSDFFARLIILPSGRINLQDLLKAAGPVSSAVAINATNTGAASAQEIRATALNDSKKIAQTASQTLSQAPTSAAANATNAPIINFGPVSLVNGRVAFSDRFVKPNYSADLTELTGKLSAFSSINSSASAGATPSMADLELRGRAEGTASLEVLGKLNPLAKPLALDITGKVRDLELPPLSPYAIKYAGYGITRGKMSVDVSYLVQPDGKLTAKNKLVLNQLSFGDKVEGATASLPVKLAVALLSDRNGVIDLDLPISGSLNDPQFSLGPVIVKVIINIIVKAITSPFSLLAAAFGGGGGDELSTVAFASGSAVLAPSAQASLDKVAKALLDRPSLKLTVVGASNLEAERDGYKRARLDELVRAEKRRGVITSGGTATALVTVGAADYPALLKEAYKRADITKPRNVVGLAKDLPTDEMERLLLADVKVTDESMQALALQRGVAVKEYLATKDLPLDRLFLGASNSLKKPASEAAKPDAKPEAKQDAPWVPRADLSIAM